MQNRKHQICKKITIILVKYVVSYNSYEPEMLNIFCFDYNNINKLKKNQRKEFILMIFFDVKLEKLENI